MNMVWQCQILSKDDLPTNEVLLLTIYIAAGQSTFQVLQLH